jgi:TolB-like protein
LDQDLIEPSNVLSFPASGEHQKQSRSEGNEPFATSADVVPQPRQPFLEKRVSRRKVLLAAGVIAAALAVLLLSVVTYRAGRRTTEVNTRVNSGPRTLAILPFHNLKDDPKTDFLGFSLADAVIAKLGPLSAISVRPSSAVEKYRGQVIDIQKVAAELKVDTLLAGNLVRDGDDLRITPQLIDVRLTNSLAGNY